MGINDLDIDIPEFHWPETSTKACRKIVPDWKNIELAAILANHGAIQGAEKARRAAGYGAS